MKINRFKPVFGLNHSLALINDPQTRGERNKQKFADLRLANCQLSLTVIGWWNILIFLQTHDCLVVWSLFSVKAILKILLETTLILAPLSIWAILKMSSCKSQCRSYYLQIMILQLFYQWEWSAKHNKHRTGSKE